MKKSVYLLLLGLMIIIVALIYVNKSNTFEIAFYNGTPKEAYSDEYVMSEVPMFTENDIKYVDWDQQIIMFKATFEHKLEAFDLLDHNEQTLSQFATTSRDKFFVYVNDELIYSGYYTPSLISSFFAEGIKLKDIDGGVMIENNIETDLRKNEKLYEILDKKDLLINKSS